MTDNTATDTMAVGGEEAATDTGHHAALTERKDESVCLIQCPHCQMGIVVAREDIACGIFRHGVYIAPPNEPLGPHATKETCDYAVANGLIYGCGKPFRFDGLTVTSCDYI